MQKKLYIIKAGTTFPATKKTFGDFDAWTLATCGPVAMETDVVDVEHGQALPSADRCAGVIITGSHAMVTEEFPWSLALETWVPSLLEANVPLMGICYGHQLLAKAMGGQVHFHPKGKEIGTVEIQLLPEAPSDSLFASLPPRFDVHATHSQSVKRLPAGAVRLAENSFEANHAFRLGRCAWGVQFHPEYDTAIMRSYIEEQAGELTSAGKNVSELLRSVRETPQAVEMLRNFTRFAEKRQSGVK